MKYPITAFVFASFAVENGTGFVCSPTPTRISVKQSRNSSTLRVASDSAPKDEKPKLKPVILDPYLPAVDPTYIVSGSVGEGEFLISRSGGPEKEELTDENLFRIIERKASDLEVNTLVWKCLGYRFNEAEIAWAPDEVFPKWKDRFPTPPDFIGMQRIYSKDIDGPCLRNNQSLVRSIPAEHKASYLKKHMLPFGFTGYKVRVIESDG